MLAPPSNSGRPRVRVYVRRWRDILDENRRRTFTSNLEHDPTLEEGLGHIREQYADLLPAAVAGAARTSPTIQAQTGFLSRSGRSATRPARPRWRPAGVR